MFRKLILAVVSALVSAAALGQIPISGLPNANVPLGSADQIIVNQKVTATAYSTRQAPLSALSPFFPSLTSHYLLQAADPTLTQSRVLAGTANQVILTDGGALGNLTLSLPQSICLACTPTFGGLTLTGALNGTSGAFSGPLSSAGYSGTTGTFSGALSAGSLSLTTPLPATSGGTGFGVYAIGDLLTASATNTLSKLSDVAAGAYLRSGGVATVPVWSTLTLPNAATTGDLLMATGTNVVGVRADVAAGSYLRSAGAGVVPVYSTTTIPNTAVLGDIWYGSAGNVVSALTGNITTAQQFLSQTGSGAVSAAPVWSALPGGFTGFANPTGTVGLTAVNGSAVTAMRSDGAPPLSQAIAPTWTANHIWSQTANSILIPVTITNPNTGTGAGVDLDLSNGTRQFKFLYTGTAFTGNPLSAQTGEQGDIYTSGAFPLLLGVNNLARLSMNNAAAGRQVDMVGTTATSSAVAYAGILDQAGVRYGYFGKASTASVISYESDADVQLVANNGTDSLNISTGHVLNFNSLFTVASTAMLYTAGPIRTQQGVSASTGSGVAVTVFTMPSTTLITTYLVTCFLAVSNDINNYGAIAMVSGSTSSSKVTIIQSAALMTITSSGLNVQCTQGSGAANTINYAALRWGNI